MFVWLQSKRAKPKKRVVDARQRKDQRHNAFKQNEFIFGRVNATHILKTIPNAITSSACPGKYRMQASQLLLLIEKCSGWNPQGICEPSNFTRSSFFVALCFSLFAGLIVSVQFCYSNDTNSISLLRDLLLNWLIGDMDTVRRPNAHNCIHTATNINAKWVQLKETSNYVMRI